MKPRFRALVIPTLILFIFFAAVVVKTFGQSKTGTAKEPFVSGAKIDDKKLPVTSVDFSASDVGRITQIRFQLDQFSQAYEKIKDIKGPAQLLQQKIDELNAELSNIIKSYKIEGWNLRTDRYGSWIGADAVQPAPLMQPSGPVKP